MRGRPNVLKEKIEKIGTVNDKNLNIATTSVALDTLIACVNEYLEEAVSVTADIIIGPLLTYKLKCLRSYCNKVKSELGHPDISYAYVVKAADKISSKYRKTLIETASDDVAVVSVTAYEVELFTKMNCAIMWIRDYIKYGSRSKALNFHLTNVVNSYEMLCNEIENM